MKRLAIALILIAAAPAVADASSNFMREVSGRTEVVADSYPAGTTNRLISSKSSRPQPQRRATTPNGQPLEARLNPGWL
jgi:hypothetical protein